MKPIQGKNRDQFGSSVKFGWLVEKVCLLAGSEKLRLEWDSSILIGKDNIISCYSQLLPTFGQAPWLSLSQIPLHSWLLPSDPLAPAHEVHISLSLPACKRQSAAEQDAFLCHVTICRHPATESNTGTSTEKFIVETALYPEIQQNQ
jgi:hypothetical protein